MDNGTNQKEAFQQCKPRHRIRYLSANQKRSARAKREGFASLENIETNIHWS